MTVALPEEKCINVRQLCEATMAKTSHTIREVLHVVGTLNSYGVTIQSGDNHFKELEFDQIQALKRSKGDFDSMMYISEGGYNDMRWWYSNELGALKHINTNIPCRLPDSNIGWGAFFSVEKRSQNGRRNKSC